MGVTVYYKERNLAKAIEGRGQRSHNGAWQTVLERERGEKTEKSQWGMADCLRERERGEDREVTMGNGRLS
jgi:hypothetical protein